MADDPIKKLKDKIAANRKRFLDNEKLLKEKEISQENLALDERISSDLQKFMQNEKEQTRLQRKRTIDSLYDAGKNIS